MVKQKGMSFVEKAGLLFGFVGLLADFAALVAFTYGFASLEQFVPSNITSNSASSFFRWFSGLVIIYGWFITSWYLTRRTFVLRYEKPRGYKNPLRSRSIRTIFGVGLFLVPTFIYWSIVNATPSGSTIQSFQQAPSRTIEAATLTPKITPTTEVIATLINTDTAITNDNNTPEPTLISTSEASLTPEHLTSTVSPTNVAITPTRTPTPEEIEQSGRMIFGMFYYMFIFPIGLFFFGLVIYASINSLMPIVHVELLDDYE